VRRFELALPRSVDEALKVLKDRGSDAKLLAGGTDLLPQLKNGLIKPACVIDLSGVERVRSVQGDARGLRVGEEIVVEGTQHNGVVNAQEASMMYRIVQGQITSRQGDSIQTTGGPFRLVNETEAKPSFAGPAKPLAQLAVGDTVTAMVWADPANPVPAAVRVSTGMRRTP
jgi:hypothetical protein